MENMKMNIKKSRDAVKKTIVLICAYIAVGALFIYFDISLTRENFLIYGVLMFGGWVLLKHLINIKDRRIYLLSGIFSFLLGGSFVVGKSLFIDWNLEKIDIIMCFSMALLFFCIVPNLVVKMIDYSDRFTVLENNHRFDIRSWLVRTLVIFVCWIPYFLTFYPGSGSSDSYDIVMQAWGGKPISNHHPVAFTLFVRFCLKIGTLFGGMQEGIAFFSIIQMLILALVFSACVEWLKKWGVPKAVIWFATAFWALNPIIAVYSFTMWKDVLFGGWILLFVVCLYDIIRENSAYVSSAKNLTKLAVLSVITAFGRNNGIYVVVFVLVTVISVYRKYWRRLLPFSLIVIIAILTVQGPIYSLFGIKKSEFVESVSIPLQQVGHTVATDGEITGAQEDFIENLLNLDTIKEVYNPYSADAIKFNKGFSSGFLEEHKGEFLTVWAQMLPHNLKGYIEAFGMQTMGYWYTETANWKCTFGLEYAEQYGLDRTNFVQKLTGIDSSNLIQDFVAVNDIIPAVSYLFKVALPVWIILFLIVLMICQKRAVQIISLVPLLGVWGTLMIAAPVYCEFRYMFSLHLAIPVLIAMLFLGKKNETTDLNQITNVQKDIVNADVLGKQFLRLAVAVLLALIGCKYMSLELNSNATIPLLFLIYSFYILLNYIIRKVGKKEKVAALFFSVLWSTAFVIGRKIDIYNKVFSNSFELFDIIRIAAFTLMSYTSFTGGIDLLIRNEVKNSGKKEQDRCFDGKKVILGALILMLCWSPYFLTFFPGNLSADSYSSISQVTGGEMLNNHHPVMFTVLVGICIKIGSLFGGLESGIAIFSLLQMGILALTLSYCLEWMREKRIQLAIRVCSFLFFGFSPLIGMYSITMWKDILFSCWVLLLVMILYDIVSKGSPSCIMGRSVLLKILLLCILIAFNRNNGIYIVTSVLLVLLIYGRTMWKKLIPVFGGVIAVIVLIQGPGYNAMHILKGSFAEAVGVPLQQIAYTVKNDGEVTEEQKQFLEQIMPLDEMKEAYDPTSSNGVKFHDDFNNEFLADHKAEFIKVWAEMLLNNPGDYIKAYCMQTMGFWHVDTIGYTYVYGADDYWIDVNNTNIIEKILGIDLTYLIQNRLPVLCTILPFVSLFFSTAVPIWFLFISVLILIIKRRKSMIISLVPLVVLWGTIMIATPTYGEFRYVFCLNLAIPFITTVILSNNWKKEEKLERNENYGKDSSFNPMLQ